MSFFCLFQQSIGCSTSTQKLASLYTAARQYASSSSQGSSGSDSGTVDPPTVDPMNKEYPNPDGDYDPAFSNKVTSFVKNAREGFPDLFDGMEGHQLNDVDLSKEEAKRKAEEAALEELDRKPKPKLGNESNVSPVDSSDSEVFWNEFGHIFSVVDFENLVDCTEFHIPLIRPLPYL